MALRIQMAPEEHYGWLVLRTGCILTADFRAIEAVDESGAIRGMVGYDNWTPNSVQASMAVSSPIVWRSLIPACFEFPFNECRRGVLLGVILSKNERSLKLARSLGFTEVYRVKDGFREGTDLVVHEMRKEDCRFLTGQRKVA